MFDVGGGELILIVMAIILLFGPKKLPEIAKTMSKGFREVKKAQQEFTTQIKKEVGDIENPINIVKEKIQDHTKINFDEKTKK